MIFADAVPVANGWEALVMVLPSVLACFSATLAAVLAFLARQQGLQTHHLINSRMTELLTATSKASLAEGHAAGVKDEADRRGPN
jgi:hypothetical protein